MQTMSITTDQFNFSLSVFAFFKNVIYNLQKRLLLRKALFLCKTFAYKCGKSNQNEKWNKF